MQGWAFSISRIKKRRCRHSWTKKCLSLSPHEQIYYSIKTEAATYWTWLICECSSVYTSKLRPSKRKTCFCTLYTFLRISMLLCDAKFKPNPVLKQRCSLDRRLVWTVSTWVPNFAYASNHTLFGVALGENGIDKPGLCRQMNHIMYLRRYVKVIFLTQGA